MILYTNVSEDRSITYLKKYSTTTDWKLMCALLIALTNLVSFTDLQTFSPVFPYIFSVATNENPKVRLSLLSLVEELSIDYGQAFYKKTRKLYEKKILAFLEDPVPRIKIMSTFTIISYLNEIPKKESKRKLLYLIPKIKKCIEDKVYYFIPEILSLASEFVHHLDTEAQEFAPELIPLTFGLKFEGLSPADEINFNGKIMEFISIFIQAINEPNLINPYKEQILNMLLVNQGKIKNEITLNEIYILDAWQRMALIYKKDIQNYLGVVIGKMIPLGIKYMKDKHELQAINEAFKGSFPRIYHTEVNRDQEIIKNLGEILKIYLEYSEHEAIKNYETIILFLTTSYQTIISGLIHKKDKVQAIEEISEDEDNIFYQDFHYFYKDLISCSFLFLQHYSKIASKDIFLSGYRRVTNALWQIAEKNQMNEKPLIKLQYKVFESLRYSILELEKDSFTNNDLTQITTRIRAEWQRILTIDFEDFSNEEDENEDEDLNEEESFEDFRIDIYFVIHELISNLLKILSDDQKEVIIQEIFPELYLCYLDDYFPKEELNEVEEDILSSIMFSLVEILQDVTAEFIHENLPWKKILESLIKYTLNPDYLIRHNSCYALGFFHEKVENHHDLFPEILNYVTKSIENLEKASHLKEENIEISDYEINNDHENNINNDSIENNNNNENDNIIINNENNDIENNSENNIEVSSAEETNTDYLECLDNVYSGIGRMIKVYFGNNEYIKPEFIHLYLKYLPIKYDQEEGRDQHEMILGVLIKFWVEIIQMKEENYLEILRIISELCLEINKDLADIKVMKKIKKLAKVMKNSNLERFTVNIDKLSSDLKTALEICLNNKEFDED